MAVADERAGRWVLAAAFAVFLLFAYSLVPLMVRLFLRGQEAIGNAEAGPIRWARAHQNGIVYGVWALWSAGLLIAAPVMLHDMFGWRPAIGPAQGLLVADIGMTLDEVRARSTLKLPEPLYVEASGQRKLIADVVFDFEIPGGGIRFPSCRYYWIDSGDKEDTRIAFASIGVSPQSLSRAELVLAHKTVRAHLEREGWRAGEYHYTTEEQRTLHGGATSSGRGVRWLKGDTVLTLLGKRADEEVRGEDPETAGRWFQYVELTRRDASSNEGLVWEPPAPSAR